MVRLMRFLKAEAGTSAIEYALIASLIAMAILAGITALGTTVQNSYTDTATEVKKVLN